MVAWYWILISDFVFDKLENFCYTIITVKKGENKNGCLVLDFDFCRSIKFLDGSFVLQNRF
nr:MAG TPA: hypothetical protein [Caudoviricetes sp.]